MTSSGTSLARLKALLAGDGILHSTNAEQVVHRDGSPAPWMLYTWNVTMLAEGQQLAGECLLERLAAFRSTQLAAHGMTGLPLVAACVRAGNGRYTGVAVRHSRKAYLSRRLVEGPLDRSRPVVVIDDSLSSGTALRAAIAALEAEGCTVEGALVLVNFPNRGGLEWATAAGYRVESLFDIAADLGQHLYPPPRQPPVLPSAADCVLPEGLPAAVLARRVAEHVLAFGTRPVPPATLDHAHDGRGGVFVSFRRQLDDHRLARDGLWHFDAEPADGPRDVVDATIATLRTANGAIHRADLDTLKIAVTFLGPMLPIAPRQLDFDRWAIVVRDDTGRRAGGALPNTQVFTSEAEQYRHAWQRNATIGPTEEHRLYRQEVDKNSEPGVTWPAYGAADPPELAWSTDPAAGATLTRWARDLLGGTATPVPPDDPVGSRIDGVAVTLYRRGTLASAVSWGPGPATERIRDAVAQLRSRADAAAMTAPDVALMVGVLHEPEPLGGSARLAAQKVRRGLDAVRVDAGGTTRVLLPGALVYNGWSKEQLIAALVSGMSGQHRFTTYRTALWVDGERCRRPVRSGFPVREPAPDDPIAVIRALAGFTLRNLGQGGVPLYRLDMVSGQRSWVGTAPRQLHALMGLHRAGRLLDEPDWTTRALEGFDRYLTDGAGGPGGFGVDIGGPLADAIVVAAIGTSHPLSGHPSLEPARRRLQSWVDPFGRIRAAPVRLGSTQDLEFLPGAVLVALASDPQLLADVPVDRLERALSWQRHRFRVLRGWGHLGWQLQGWAAVFGRRRRDEQAEFVFELADWALDRQLEKNGAFLEDMSPTEPSFNTGFLAEGIAAAWTVARTVHDADRTARYRASWQAANGFMRTLLVTPEDTFCSADPGAVLGGVRLTPSVPHVRADSVSHWLNALVTGASLVAR